LPSNTATQLFVVPKSIPIILLMVIDAFCPLVTNAVPSLKRTLQYVKMSQYVSMSPHLPPNERQKVRHN